MEIETQEQEVGQVEQKSSLHQVTPLSKYLAMALFIILPFLGGYVGYTFAPEKVVEVEKAVIHNSTSNDSSDWTLPEPQTAIEIESPKLSRAEYLLNEYKINTGKTYEVSSTSIRVLESGAPHYFSADYKDNFQEFLHLDIEEAIAGVTALPYLTVLASTNEELILTSHCFAAKECRYSNLYKLDIYEQTLTEMTIGEFYNDVQYGSQLSPSKRKVISAMGYQGYGAATSSDLYLLDLFSDSYRIIGSHPATEKKFFCLPTLGCDLQVEWLSTDEIEVGVFNEIDSMIETEIYKFQ